MLLQFDQNILIRQTHVLMYQRKRINWVFKFKFDIHATIILESIPPLKNAATSTSEIILFLIVKKL